MRKSKSATRARLARAGLTTGVVGASLLVAPQAAFAVGVVTPAGPHPVGSTVTITENTTPFTASNASKVQLLSGVANCNAKYTTPTGAILAVPVNTSTTSVITFEVPAAATTNGQVKRYIACVYGGSVAGTSDLQGSATGYPVTVGALPAANPQIGPSGGGNSITVTAAPGAAVFTGISSPSAVFSTADCPSLYGAPTAGTTAAVTKTSDSVVSLSAPATTINNTVGPTAYNVCFYNGTAASSTLFSYVPYNVSLLNLSQTTGPFGGGNGLNVTSPTEYLAGIDTPGVVFSSGACPGTYTETAVPSPTPPAPYIKPVATANVRKLTNNRLAVTAPQFFGSRSDFLTAFASGTSVWNMCLYGGQEVGTSVPVYSAPYSITTVASATKVTPSAGPALGGRKITVSGVALPTEPGKLTATLGGTPLLDIQVINSGAFTAITPMHAPANNVALVLSTSAGSSTLTGAYSYTSSLSATPNTAPNTRPVDIIVNGVGFQSPNWNNGQAGAHIYLVKGTYEGSDNGGSRANPGEGECLNVLPLSDTELVCTLALDRRLDAAGTAAYLTPNERTTATITTALGSRVITVAVVALTKLDVGLSITSANLPAGTTIVDVLDATHAVVSSFPTAAASGTASVIAAPTLRSSIALSGLANSGTTFTTATGNITAADIGRRITGTDITANTRITGVSVSGGTATVTVSPALVSSIAGGGTSSGTIAAGYLPVPEGAYNLTYVSNGNAGAQNTDPDYVQSIISSASTFTVSSF